jgi:hypothetical protein
MKNSAMLALLLLASPVAACDRNDQAPQDSQSGKAPTGMIDPGPGAPSRERAAQVDTGAATGGAGAAGAAGNAGGGGSNGGGSNGGGGGSGGSNGGGGAQSTAR